MNSKKLKAINKERLQNKAFKRFVLMTASYYKATNLSQKDIDYLWHLWQDSLQKIKKV